MRNLCRALLFVVVLLVAVGSAACNSGSKDQCEGAQDCPCYPNGTCDSELQCLDGTCGLEEPVSGTGGGGGGDCQTPGLTCPCTTNEECGFPDSGLQCDDLICVSPDYGELSEPCYQGTQCMPGLTCVEGGTCECPAGAIGCDCFEDDTCEVGLTCDTSGMCVTPRYEPENCAPGTAGCPCDNGTCMTGLTCDGFRCIMTECQQGRRGCGCAYNSIRQINEPVDYCTDGVCINGICAPHTAMPEITCTNTLTDADHCGYCGHMCSNGSCQNGMCENNWYKGCITENSGYTNCSEYCASIGETCADCNNGQVLNYYTGEGFRCSYLSGDSNILEPYSMTCDTPFDWRAYDNTPGYGSVTCCCTDTL